MLKSREVGISVQALSGANAYSPLCAALPRDTVKYNPNERKQQAKN